MQHEKIEGFKILGQLDAAVFDMRSREAQEIETAIDGFIAARQYLLATASLTDEDHENLRQDYLKLRAKLGKFAKREMSVTNLVTTAGRSVLAQRLANTTTYTGIINYGALGSSSTAVANADTQLGTEVFRKTTASTSFTNNVAFIDFFYSKADTNGTYQEFGTFIDGTASANTGQLFNHALTGGWTKLATESMTVSVTFTLS